MDSANSSTAASTSHQNHSGGAPALPPTPGLLDVKAAHATVSAWKEGLAPMSVDSLMASAQLAALEWLMGDEGRFAETLRRMRRDAGQPDAPPDPLTPAQRRFVTLEKRKAEVKAFMEELEAATLALVEEMGVGAMFQDEEGTVYKTVVPAGRFVRFERYGVERTRRAGESKGALSLTDARAAGFQVEGK